MAKVKKITVKPFLNKNLKPKKLHNMNVELYPLYYRITYDRKNTQVKGFFYYEGENYFNSLDFTDGYFYKLIEFESEVIRKIISYELEKQGDQFELKGISQKINDDDEGYLQPITFFLFNSHVIMLKNISAMSEDHKFMDVLKYDYGNFKLLQTASEKLFSDFDLLMEQYGNKLHMKYMIIYQELFPIDRSLEFSPFIDWYTGEHLNQLKTKLHTEYPNYEKYYNKMVEWLKSHLP